VAPPPNNDFQNDMGPSRVTFVSPAYTNAAADGMRVT
jgi:hypothetical protein